MLFLWPLVFFGKILNHCGKYSAAVAMVCAFVAWVCGVVDAMVTLVVKQVAELFNSLTLGGIGNANMNAIDMIGYVNSVFPVSEFITLCGIYTTAWIAVILIRWIKSFVPTMAN